MTEVQKRRKLVKIIRVQWLVILGLLFAFILTVILACTTKTSAGNVESDITTTVISSQVTATPLVSASEDIVKEPELIFLGEYKLTAYCPCVKCCGIWSTEHHSKKGTDYIQKTASGTVPKEGRTVAVDTSVIPFGTVIVIDGHEYVAEDRGGAVKENIIDIFFENHNDAVNFGVQYKTIYIKGDKLS